MIDVNISLLFQIVNFVFLIFVLNIVLFKPIRNILTQRQDKINGLEQGIETSIRDAKEKDEAFAEGIKAARAEGLKQKEALLGEAESAEKKMINEINEKALEELGKVKARVADEAEKARQELMSEIDAFADAIGQKILGRAV